ncbi:phage tail protein [Paratissierella segnis]
MATELGQAYVQIIPSAKGISGAIRKELDPEATSAGKSAGSKIASAIKKVIAVAGIGKAIGAALTAGGDLQQSLGGVETLFKENADKVKQYANDAYKTAGLSANDYMENVTSFSASLLQSMGGNTEKAADKANMAMVDMSDNANKFGTDMKDIQNAYQGFAKQNYTMLDNLKLGYGGTKTEMERLLADATKLTGVKYDINNLADVYDAIHAVQEELGVTGTTALESAETLSGSLASMKGAFSNFLGNLALGQDVTPSLQALAQTVSTFLFGNFIPMIGNILKALPGAIVTFIQEAAPYFLEAGTGFVSQLATGITTGLPNLLSTLENMAANAMSLITEKLPIFLDKGIEIITNIVNGIFQSIPKLVESAGNVISTFVEFIMKNLPTILKAGKDLILNLVDGIIKNLPAVIDSAIKAVSNFIDVIIKNYPEYFKTGWKIITELVAGIIDRLPELIATAVTLMAKFVAMLISKIPDVLSAGKDIVIGLWEGITSMADWLVEKIKGFASNIAQAFKNFFGIKSPSTLMAEYGRYIDEGLAVGIEKNAVKPISKAQLLAEAVGTALSKVNEYVTSTVSILQKEFDLWALKNNAVAESSKYLGQQLEMQKQKHEMLNQQIAVTTQALNDALLHYGAGSIEAMKYKEALLDLQIQQENLSKSIEDANSKLLQQRTLTSGEKASRASSLNDLLESGWITPESMANAGDNILDLIDGKRGGGGGGNNKSNSPTISQVNNIYSPKALSPSEIAKEAAKAATKIVLPLLR